VKGKSKTPIVLFNASVILAGLKSPTGGSAKLLRWSNQKRIIGITSEIILNEVTHHARKIGFEEKQIIKSMLSAFAKISPAPKSSTVKVYDQIVLDHGDAHVLASGQEAKAEFLVTLDKKHLLALRKKIHQIKVVSPGQLIEKLEEL
jgi:putative PIN family toxin of toxin-antitoxin system